MKQDLQIDWRKPNILLADDLGVSGERVRQLRVQHAAPAPLFSNIPRKKAVRYWSILEKRILLKGLPERYASQLLGFNVCENQAVRRFARKHAGTSWAKHPWNLMNWRLPDSILGPIWDVKPRVISVKRAKQERGKARWLPHKNSHRADIKYQKACADEASRASEFRRIVPGRFK